MTAAALVGTGLSAYQAVSAAGEKKASKNAMDNYNLHEPQNASKNISLASRGTDIMREESARTVASLTDIAKGMGARGAYGLIPKIQANANKVEEKIAMDMIARDEKRQYSIAADELKIDEWKINRDNANIAALSSQYTAANDSFNKGLWGVASGVTSTMRGLEQDKENGSTWFNND